MKVKFIRKCERIDLSQEYWQISVAKMDLNKKMRFYGDYKST